MWSPDDHVKASKLCGTEDQLQVTQTKLSEATAQLQLKEEVREGGGEERERREGGGGKKRGGRGRREGREREERREGGRWRREGREAFVSFCPY